MAQGKNLNNAKKAKNDEFYTQLTDIEKECYHYREHFRNKVIYCNCDDARESNFFKYFAMNFEFFGLKKLITTGFKADGKGVCLVYEGDKNGNRIADDCEIQVTELQGNGDFRSDECIELLKQADIVVTNPPFSLFREYVAQLVEYDKKFLIIGNMNAVTFKEIFPLIKDNKMWLGVNEKGGSRKGNSLSFINNGEVKDVSSWWYTNMDNKRRNEELILYKQYSIDDYPKYDNYDAIECGRSREIPCDYDKVIGVPISFLMFHNPSQFEIIGCCEPAISLDELKNKENFKEYKSRQIFVNGVLCQKTYHRILIRRKK
jgi:hypothetical protein